MAPERFVRVMKSVDETAIETAEMDCVYEDGGSLGQYVFFDVRRLVHAYDYECSDVVVEANERGRYISRLGSRRGMRVDIDNNIHVFREAYLRYEIFVSRALARRLVTAGVLGLVFRDPADMQLVDFSVALLLAAEVPLK